MTILGSRSKGKREQNRRVGEPEQRDHDKLATDTGSWLPHPAGLSQELYGM